MRQSSCASIADHDPAFRTTSPRYRRVLWGIFQVDPARAATRQKPVIKRGDRRAAALCQLNNGEPPAIAGCDAQINKFA